MKIQIFLTEAMAAELLTIAQHERRYPRQQAEVLLERALHTAMQESAALHSLDAPQAGQALEEQGVSSVAGSGTHC